MKKNLVISLILILFISVKVFAEDLNVQKMDFIQAINFALKNNNEIRAMKKSLSATERDIGIARSGIMPKVRLLENFEVTNNPIEAFSLKLNQTQATPGDLAFGTLDFPGAVTNFLTSGVIEQPIYNKKSMLAIKMAKKEYSANGYVYLRKEEELVNKVAEAYLGVNTAQEYINIAEQSLNDSKKHLETAEIKHKNKGGLYSDVLRTKTAVDEAEERVLSTQRNLKVAKRNLGLTLGIQNFVEISNSIPDVKLQDITYYKNSSVYRNDIKATEIRVANAKNNIQSAQADWLPTLNAVASYNLYNSSFPFGAQGSNYIAGAFFKWDAFDGNKRKYEILKAKDKEAEAKEYLEGLRKTVDFKVYEAYSNVEELQKNLDLAISAQQSAEEGAKLVLKKWKESLSPFVDMEDAQRNLNLARINLVKSRNDLKVGQINLGFESGIISQELGIND